MTSVYRMPQTEDRGLQQLASKPEGSSLASIQRMKISGTLLQESS